MQIQPECIPCILTMAIASIRKLGITNGDAKVLYKNILDLAPLRARAWDVTSPEVLEQIMELMKAAVGKEDPFDQIKALQNEQILNILPVVKEILEEASDPLYTAVKLAILGNTIDLMMGERPTDIENSIQEKLKAPIGEGAFATFKERVESCRSLVYLGDNAGEMVFDKLLIEYMTERYDLNVAYVVRSVPTLNDATLHEARVVGLHNVATVIENGIDGPCPGTILRRCSPDVKERLSNADMIISKGGGNFDALEEERGDVRRKITFMLLSKCYPYCQYFNVQMHQPILAHLAL